MSVPPSELRHVADTTPYPWPWDGRLRTRTLALLLVGWDTAWRTACRDADTVVARVATLAAAAADAGVPTVVVSHASATPRARAGRGAGAGTVLEPPHPATDRTATIEACGVDAFYGSPLDALLRTDGRDRLVVAGFGLEGPVHSTLRSANDRGYECLLAIDACASASEAPSVAAAARSSVEMSGGIFGAVGETDQILAVLGALKGDQ